MQNLLFFLAFMIIVLMQSCIKEQPASEIIIDPFTYSKKIDFVEDSIRIGNGSWTKIPNGNIFSWLSNGRAFNQNSFAVYPTAENLQTSFDYIIKNDRVIGFSIALDSLYFTNSNKDRRTDLKGKLIFKTDTTLVIDNKGVSPAISIIYKLKN